MTKKKVLPQASAHLAEATPVPEVTTPPKKPASVTKKASAKVVAAKPQKTAKKTPVKTPTPMAAKTSTRSPADSTTSSKSGKPARAKKTALPTAAASALQPDPLTTNESLADLATQTSHKTASSPEKAAAETPVTPTVKTPVVNDAELWEQGSPIRTRIAQLRTRNSLLEEQLQRLRPPVQVRGKKK